MFEHYDRLGFMTPYYVCGDDGHLVIDREFCDIAKVLDKPRRLDVAAVIELISRYHCFAERTLIRGIHRTPWMARPNDSNTDWKFALIPPHDQRVMSADDIAETLFTKLQEEILEYCDGQSTVGLLLSGGMDSRIVAGVLEYLIETRQISTDVVAITWGTENSRDVIYAREIAERIGWHWEYYPLSPDNLLENITYTAQRGCEYSPIHLHAIPRIRELRGLDCVLVASFGDSVGRAEYSGKHITQVRPFHSCTFNWFRLLRRDQVSAAIHRAINSDIERYRELFPRKEYYQQREIDKQAHYMRRMLNPTLSVIDEAIPVFQVFSSPSVFGFMWSLAPRVRNDEVYAGILDLFVTNTTDIPWSRTGLLYLSNSGTPDEYSRLQAPYGKWIRQEIYDTIKAKATSGTIEQLGTFNMGSIHSCLDVNYRFANWDRHTKIDEILIWLASLADFVEMYDIQGVGKEPTWMDALSGKAIAPLGAAIVMGVNKLRGYG